MTVPNRDRKSTRLNSSHQIISYAVFCLKKKNNPQHSKLYDSNKAYRPNHQCDIPDEATPQRSSRAMTCGARISGGWTRARVSLLSPQSQNNQRHLNTANKNEP